MRKTTDQSVFRYSLSSKEGKKEGTLKGWLLAVIRPLCQFPPRATIKSNLLKNDRAGEFLIHRLAIPLTFDPRSELPRNEFNIPLLEQVARVSGAGSIRKKWKDERIEEEIVLVTKPLRSLLILLVSILFLLEVMFRKFVFRPDL